MEEYAFVSKNLKIYSDNPKPAVREGPPKPHPDVLDGKLLGGGRVSNEGELGRAFLERRIDARELSQTRERFRLRRELIWVLKKRLVSFLNRFRKGKLEASQIG